MLCKVYNWESRSFSLACRLLLCTQLIWVTEGLETSSCCQTCCSEPHNQMAAHAAVVGLPTLKKGKSSKVTLTTSSVSRPDSSSGSSSRHGSKPSPGKPKVRRENSTCQCTCASVCSAPVTAVLLCSSTASFCQKHTVAHHQQHCHRAAATLSVITIASA